MNSDVKRRLVISRLVITSLFSSILSSGTQINRCFLSINLSLYYSLLSLQSSQDKGKTIRRADLDLERLRFVKTARGFGSPSTRAPSKVIIGFSFSLPFGVLLAGWPLVFQVPSVGVTLFRIVSINSSLYFKALLFCLLPSGGAYALFEITLLYTQTGTYCLSGLNLQNASDSRLSVQLLSKFLLSAVSLVLLLLLIPQSASGSAISSSESTLYRFLGSRPTRNSSAYQAVRLIASAFLFASSTALTASFLASYIPIQLRLLPQFLPPTFFLYSRFTRGRRVRFVLSSVAYQVFSFSLRIASVARYRSLREARIGQVYNGVPLLRVGIGIASIVGVLSF